jgi:peptidoglycan/LPS O-acetylase OafA/YrhL
MSQRFFQPGLTGFRALAACWVMLFHLNAIVGPQHLYLGYGWAKVMVTPLVTIGWVGVVLFFVLSGFLLTTHLLEARSTGPWPQVLNKYFWARVRRVFPAYWVQIAILFVIALLAARSLPDWTKYLPLHALMLHNLLEKSSFAINAVYWTLPIEFGFYLALPLFVRALVALERIAYPARLARLALLVAAVILFTWSYRYVAFRMYPGSPGLTITWALSQLPGSIDQFVIGSAAAAGLRWWTMAHPQASPRGTSRVSTACLVAGLGGIFAMMYFMHNIYATYWSGHWALFVWHTATSVFVALTILAIALSGRLTRLLFENRVALFLGTISYSIYLWHGPVATWVAGVVNAKALGLGGFLAIAGPAIIAVSALSYYLVERPFLASARPGERPAPVADPIGKLQ